MDLELLTLPIFQRALLTGALLAGLLGLLGVLVTAREIIYLWVARMIFLGLHFVGDIPFQQVFPRPSGPVQGKDADGLSWAAGPLRTPQE